MAKQNASVAVQETPRRKRRSSEEVADRILEAAAEEFETAGYSGATTAAIARRAEVTEAQIFRFYGSKQELFRAAIVAVPLLDMLRYQDFLMARYWVPEYGSAEDAAQFAFLHAYSPYHHVKPGTRYPAVFLTAGEHDTRVHALHARKMTALLQGSTASDPGQRPVLLWVDRESGHGQGKPLNLKLREAVDLRSFLMWQLGM